MSSPPSTPRASRPCWSSTIWRRLCGCAAGSLCWIREKSSPTARRTTSWRMPPSARPISARGASMLRLEHLSCGYGAIRAVEDVSIDVPAGSVLALLGPNGAGKTSTIMAIMGHTTIHAGRLLFEDRDITAEPAVMRAPLGIAVVPEGRRLFSDLTVDDNL